MRNSKFSFVFALFFVLMSVSAFAVSVTPSNPASNLDLTCNAGSPASAYIYEWYLNGNRYLIGGNSWVVSNGLTSVGQTWRCDVYFNVAGHRTSMGSASATIINTAPVTTITSFRNGTEGQTQINFTGTAIDNVDFDSISSWNWNFGDGITANTASSASHIYLRNGTYTLTLSATDSNGGSSSTTKQIVIADRAPVVNFSSTTPSPENRIVNFTDMAVSYDPISFRTWTFGDGTGSVLANTTHSYGNDGTYLVTFNVTDNDGSLTSFSRNVVITDLGPFANFSQNMTVINEGQYVSYNDLSTTPLDPIVGWQWDLENGFGGVGSNNQNISYQYLRNGTFSVNLTVTDSDGSTSFATRNITVNDLGPRANFTISTNNTIAGQPIRFNSTSYSFPDSIVSYQWAFNGPWTPGNSTQNHTYNIPGNYSAYLLVTDSDGSWNQAGPFVINVRSAPVVPFKNYTIGLSSKQNNNANTNYGKITFNSANYTLPNQINPANNTYPISFISFPGLSFLRWNVSGGVNVGSLTSNPSTAIVAGNGTLTAIYYNSTQLGQSAVNLGTAGNFVILSKSGITDVPTSRINGNIGTSPITGAAITGLTCPEVNGTIYTVDNAGPACKVINAPLLTTAVLDMEIAYNDAAGRAANATNIGAGSGTWDLAGLTIAPGVYSFNGPGNVIITNDITLNGNSNSTWIFQIPGTLGISSGKHINLVGGAQAKNVFWQVAGATTLGTTSVFNGNILAKTNIALQTGAVLNGRALAQTAVTLQMNNISQSSIVIPSLIHDVNVSSTYINTVNGIRITNSTGSDFLGVNLTRGTTYNIRYRTDNVGNVNATYTTIVNVLNKTRGVIFTNSHAHANRPVGDQLSTDANNWNTALAPIGVYNITVNVTITGFADATPSDNFRIRTVRLTNITLPDTTPPALSLVNSSGSRNVSAVINWTSNEVSNSTVRYNNLVRRNSVFLLNHSIVLNSLTPNTTYSYNVSSCDPSGNCATLSQFNFKTKANVIIIPPSDTTPPAAITNLLVQNKTNSTIRWSWTNPVALDFNSTLVSVVSRGIINRTLPKLNTTFTISGLTANTTYRIIVLTQDNASIKNVNNTVVANLTKTLANAIIPGVPTIFNSFVNGTHYVSTPSLWKVIDNSPITSNSKIQGNSPATFKVDINITGSNIANSSVTNTYLRNVRALNSTIVNSILKNSNITRCYVKNVMLNSIVCVNSILDPPTPSMNLSGSTFINSTVLISNVTNSIVIGSTITHSNIAKSNLTTSVVSNVIGSNFVLTKVNATKSNITNSVVSNVVLTNAVIINNVFVSGNMTFPGGVVVRGSNGSIPYAPTVSSISPLSGIVGNGIAFTSNAADANNNIVSYNWSFGDNTTGNISSPVHAYGANGNYPLSLIVKDSTNLTASYSTIVSITTPPTGNSGGSGTSTQSTVNTLPIDKTLLVISGRYNWDIAKDGTTFTKTIRPIDSIIFNYQGTSYSLVVDEFKPDGLVAFKIIPTDEIRSGYKGDNFDFTIKDKKLLVSLLELDYNKRIDSESTMKLQLKLVDGNYVPKVTNVNKTSSNGIIKVMGEIVPKDTSVPVGVGISVATVLVGLLLFLGLRVLIV